MIEKLVDDDTEEAEDHDYLKAANVIKVQLGDDRVDKKPMVRANSQSSLKLL